MVIADFLYNTKVIQTNYTPMTYIKLLHSNKSVQQDDSVSITESPTMPQ